MYFNLDDGDLQTIRKVADAFSFSHELELIDKVKLIALQTRITDHQIEQAGLQAYRDAVETSEGEVECDDGAVVSVGDDGAYVMTWSYVSNEDAGVETEDDEAEEA